MASSRNFDDPTPRVAAPRRPSPAQPLHAPVVESTGFTNLDAELDTAPAGDDWRPAVTTPVAPGSEHAVIVTDLAGTIVAWNLGAERTFGYGADEAVGMPLDILVPPECANHHREMMRRVAVGHCASHPGTVRFNKNKERIDVRLTLSQLRDAAGCLTGVIIVAHDLADIKQLEQQFCAAQKMETFGQLASGVAHDFNNLLTVILGYSEIAINRLTANDSTRDLLTEVYKAGERAEALTRQLLAFGRKKVVEPRVLDLNAVVSDTERMLRRIIGEDILMTTIFAPFLKPVKIDAGQLQQVILNLAVNARDAMPRGGRLTIETANVTRDGPAHPGVPRAYDLLVMSDTGVGMCPAVKARIFEHLFTTKRPGAGTGIGLATVHAIVDKAGGFIEVESEPDHGTIFRIYLPGAIDTVVPNGTGATVPATPRGNEVILLVEDEKSVRSLAQQVLELAGYTVIAAADGEEAVRMAEARTGPIHLLLADVVMPKLGGRPLADRLLACLPTLRVLFLSGYTNDAVLRHGVRDTEFAFLQKPFTTAGLANKVREVLDRPSGIPLEGPC